MFEWMRSQLPHMHHYGYTLVFIVVFLNNVGFPLPGETILLGAGFILGKAVSPLWQPLVAAAVACFLGGTCSFWMGRRLGESGLEKIHWLHLTPERLKWPERFFKRYGAKAVFLTRFIPLFPPVVVNLLAGMSKMRWNAFLFFNSTGSAVYATTYILLGYYFGNKWKPLQASLGNTTLYLILTGIVLIALGVVFRQPLTKFWRRVFSK